VQPLHVGRCKLWDMVGLGRRTLLAHIARVPTALCTRRQMRCNSRHTSRLWPNWPKPVGASSRSVPRSSGGIYATSVGLRTPALVRLARCRSRNSRFLLPLITNCPSIVSELHRIKCNACMWGDTSYVRGGPVRGLGPPIFCWRILSRLTARRHTAATMSQFATNAELMV
jgi:hypothetical protein